MKGFTAGVAFKVKFMLCFVALLWLVEVANLMLGYELNRFGIIPRDTIGLRGLVFSPFLHGSINHLIFNTGPLFALGLLVIFRGVATFLVLTIAVAILGGFGVWVFGQSSSVHIGASGIIFGYFGFLLFKGIFDKQFKALLVSTFVFVVYGGMIWGVFPGKEGISWEGHLFGFLAGIVWAFWTRHKDPVTANR